MMIINLSKGTVLAKEYKRCTSLFSKGIGLMFTPQKQQKPLLFEFSKEKLVQLHMLFVFYPIDVIYLNQKREIVEVKQSLKPFSYYSPKHRAQFVLELPQGSIQRTESTVGDKVEFKKV